MERRSQISRVKGREQEHRKLAKKVKSKRRARKE